MERAARYISLPEAARDAGLKVGRATLHRWATAGHRGAYLRAEYIGRSIVTTAEWFRDFLDAIRRPVNRAVPTPAPRKAPPPPAWERREGVSQ